MSRVTNGATPWRRRAWQIITAVGATLLLPLVTPVLEAPLAGTRAAEVVAALGASTADAQTVWGVSRRTGRRSGRRAARRTTARQQYLYSLPAGAAPVVVGGANYYQAGATYYQPVMAEGRMAYVEVVPGQ